MHLFLSLASANLYPLAIIIVSWAYYPGRQQAEKFATMIDHHHKTPQLRIYETCERGLLKVPLQDKIPST